MSNSIFNNDLRRIQNKNSCLLCRVGEEMTDKAKLAAEKELWVLLSGWLLRTRVGCPEARGSRCLFHPRTVLASTAISI